MAHDTRAASRIDSLQAPDLRGRSRSPALAALYGVLSVLITAPIFARPEALGLGDWDQHLFYYAVFLKNLVEYGQAPFWNPWYCGGNVMWQNPQIAILSPVYPLTAVMSLQLAMKVNIVLHYWIGFAGMHVLLTRVVGLTFLPAVIYLATLVTASGAPAIHLRAGHSVFLPGFYLPLQLYLFFMAVRTGRLKYLCLSAATLALMIFNGGTHVLPMSIAAIGTFGVAAAIARRQWQPVVFAAVFGAAGLAYAAPKLLPVVQFVSGDQFWDTRNPTEKPDLVTLEMLQQTYLVPTQDVTARLPMQRHGWHEYGNYIGPVSALGVIAGLIAVFVKRPPRDRWFGLSLGVTAMVLFLLSLGEFHAFAPASLAHHVPLFSSFRIPSRYSIPFLQFAVLAMAWAWLSIGEARRLGRPARIAAAIVMLGTAAHLIAVNQWHFRGVFVEPPFDTSFTWMGGPRQIATDADSSPYGQGSPMLRAVMEDRAFFNCYEPLQLARGAVANQPQVFEKSGTGRLHDLDFSPNRLTFSVKAGSQDAVFTLNQNWGAGWTTDAGAMAVGPLTELSSVTIPAAQSGTFHFSFVPPYFTTGMMVLAAALVATLAAWRRTVAPTA
jgi:hypothetical protein